MKFPPLIPGRFVRRVNRFLTTVNVNGMLTHAHIPNSGRLGELLTAGRDIWLAPIESRTRKTKYDLKLVEFAGVLISVDARLPNPVFEEAILTGKISGWDYPEIERERTLDDSRFDFRLAGGDRVCWVETKSVTLVENGLALFPDAPTKRGQRHVYTLSGIIQRGQHAAVVFIVQRPDAVSFSVNADIDPIFALAVKEALEVGVKIKAYTCQVTREGISIDREIPVTINPFTDYNEGQSESS